MSRGGRDDMTKFEGERGGVMEGCIWRCGDGGEGRGEIGERGEEG